MPLHRPFRLIAFFTIIAAAMILAGCSTFSLAADVTPPPDYTPPAPGSAASQPVAASTAFPLLAPDPANGAVIYASKCLPCHGQSGLGDGPQASNLPSRPAEIGNPDFARKSRPADWFQVVTDGNLKKFMPGFTGSLDDRQRWDVIAYVYTLSSTPKQIQDGKALYDSKCASCHGPNGKADGPDAAGKSVLDWSKQDRLSQFSADMLDGIITAGKAAMPAYTDYTLDQRMAMIAYIRTMSFASASNAQANAESTPTIAAADSAAGTVTPAATPPAETPSAGTPASGTPVAFVGKVTLKGTITGQNGLKVPPDLDVALVTYEGMNQVAQVKGKSAADGTFTFEVDNKSGIAYMAQVTYNNYTFNSDILHASDIATSSAAIPVVIYETTTDLAGLSIDRMHIFFDFTKPATVQVAELFIISNSGQKVVVAAGPDKPVLSFKLPAGAVNLQFDSGAIGDRYVQTADGFGDLAAIAPGQSQHQLLYSYEIPYNNKVSINLPVPMAVNAAVVLMPQGGVNLTSSQFQASGSQDVQGTTYRLYTASNISAGTSLTMELSGAPNQATAAAAGTGNNTTGLLIGLGVFGLALVAAGFWLLRQRAARQLKADPEPEEILESETEESLLDAILALDDLYQAGKLPKDAYQQRRGDLKARLRAARGG